MTDVPQTCWARTVDGAYLAYQVFGEGPTDLLYVPGWHSHLDVYWEQPLYASFMRRLARSFRVITFDKRGTGLSERSLGTPDFETMMDDVRTVLDAAASRRPVLWGDGPDGGGSCAVFAASFPDRALAFIWWRACARTLSAVDYPWGQRLEGVIADDAFIEQAWGDEQHGAELLEFVGCPSLTDDPAARRWIAKFFRYAGTPNGAKAFHEWYLGIDVRAVLSSIHVPTFVAGALSDRAEADAGAHLRYIVSHIPGAVSADLGGADFPAFLGDQARILDQILAFVDSVRREEQELDRVLATVLFTDVVGSTGRACEMGDACWQGLLEKHHATVRTLLARYRGTEVKTMGDGFLATFDGPARAVKCAQGICEAVRPLGLEVRAGCHTGEIELLGADVGGVAVHIGARVAALAGPSEVLVSSTVKDLVAGSGLVFSDRGEYELKGVPGSWRLYSSVK
ncbi:MAG: adenylate/guanylate cyclase domain-containing protein [Actinobacteria bacterium]|nr:adenylate/guanylate cyclase domain-containing protein [Actinomycetota bacterium]